MSQVKNVYQNLKINLKIHQRHIHNSMEHPRGSIFHENSQRIKAVNNFD